MKQFIFLFLSFMWILPSAYGKKYAGAFKAPAYPLITLDPYISAWSISDTLYHSTIRHWSGKKFPLQGILTVDGQPYRFMGKAEDEWQYVVELLKVNETETTFTCHQPSLQWNSLSFDDRDWKKGCGSYGKPGMPYNKTTWSSNEEDIWIRREFTIDNHLPSDSLYLQFTIDKSAEFYLNGEKLLDNQDLCFMLKVSTKTLQRYRKKGILPYIMLDGKYFYRTSDIHKLIRERTD